MKENRIYVHVLEAEDPLIYVPTGDVDIKSASNFDDGSAVKFTTTNGAILLTLPDIAPGKVDHIIVLEM
jgi:hypothetical protein